MTLPPPRTPASTQRADGSDDPAVSDAGPHAADRIRDAYVQEAMALLGEGVPAHTVEGAGLRAGLTAAPLAMLDEMSLDRLDEALHRMLDQGHEPHDDHDHDHDHRNHHVHEHGHGHGHGHGHDHQHRHEHAASSRSQAPQMPESAVYVLEKMAHGYRRTGRAAGAGFYDYPPDEPAQLWPGLSAFERGGASIDEQDVVDRLLYAPVLESLRCLQDGMAADKARDTSSPDAAVSLVRPAEVIGRIGAACFVERADELAARYGERFRAPALLRDQVARVGPR